MLCATNLFVDTFIVFARFIFVVAAAVIWAFSRSVHKSAVIDWKNTFENLEQLDSWMSSFGSTKLI